MTSKVPKFGAWGEGGDNFTVYFDNARKTKNGPKINPNVPEENPEMFQPNPNSTQPQTRTQTASTQTKPGQQRKQNKVPKFGAWENEESAGYTVCFDNVRKNKNNGPTAADNEPQMDRDMPQGQIRGRARPSSSGPTVADNEPQMNRDMHQARGRGQGQARPSSSGPTVGDNELQMNRDMHQARAQGQSRGQARPSSGRPNTREGQAKVPEFGEWDSQGGGGGYTAVFENLSRKPGPISNGPQPNRDVGSTAQEGKAKVPEFGAWEEGEAVQYTAYFDNAKKIKNLREGGMNANNDEPQMNRDVGYKGRGPPVNGGRGSTGSVQVHPKANVQIRPGGGRGNQAGSVPQFGGWNDDPTQAGPFTMAFDRAKEEGQTPVHNNIPLHVPKPQHQYQQQRPQPQPQQQQQPRPQQPHYNNNRKQPGCCTIM